MRNYKILILSLLLIPVFVFSSHGEEIIPTPASYLFHLYYDNGQLFADRDVEFKYDVVPEKFVPETLNTQFPYKGEVVNLNNQVAFTFQFDPRQGNPKFLKGTLSVKAPYAPDGQKVNFYDGQGNQLLSISVSESSFCNDDGACNSDVGEDTKTCPFDCKQVLPVPTTPTGPSAGAGGMPKVLIYLIIGVAVIGGWYGHRHWRGPAGSGDWKWWKGRQVLSPIIQNPQNPVVNFPDAQSAMPEATEKSTTGQNPNVQ